MLLAIDVGNSNTVLGLYNHDSPDLVADWRITTHKNQTSDEYGVLFMNLFAMRQIDVSKISAIVVSSVVPPLDTTLRRLCERYFGLRPSSSSPASRLACRCSLTIRRSSAPIASSTASPPSRAMAAQLSSWILERNDLRCDLGARRIRRRGHRSRPRYLRGCSFFARSQACPCRHQASRARHRHQHHRAPAERAFLRLHRPCRRHPGAHARRNRSQPAKTAPTQLRK